MLSLIFKPLSLLSLDTIHKLGSGLGWVLFHVMSKARQETKKNIQQSGLFEDEIATAVKQSFNFLGQSILETPYIWHCDNTKIKSFIKERHGWAAINAGLNQKKGIIFITPHMGCIEIAPLYYALHHPISVLYRQSKIKWLESLIRLGRGRNNIKLAPANIKGVKTLMQALKRGESVGILPDQMPKAGEGEWADFFGKPAYTMTLASKLAIKTGAMVIMLFTERLSNGEGFAIHLTKLDAEAIKTPELLNKAIELQIKSKPIQYLWSYRRFKTSRKIKPPPR